MLRQFLLCPCLLWPLACSERTPEASGEEWFESVESLRDWNPSGFIGDFDGDGFDDIALRSRTEPGMAILYGRADSTIPETPDLILPPHQEGPPGSAGVVPLGDINGDGLDDVAVVDPTQGESTVFFGRPRTQDGEPSQAVERSFFVDTGVVWPLGDLDADGIDDIGVFFTSTAQHLRAGIVRGRTNWSDIDRESLPTDSIVIENPKASPQRVGDINGDGHDDLAASPSGGALSLHSGATLPWGTTVVDTLPAPDLGGLDAPADQSPFVDIPGAYVPGVSVYPLGDLDGDELDDFAAGHMWSERPVTFVIYGSTVPLLRSRASLSAGQGGYRIDGEAESLLAADVNQDGSTDLVFGGVGTTDSAWVLDRTKMPTLSVRAVLHHHPAATPPASGVALPRPAEARRYGVSMTSGDFNGDGAIDLVAGFDVVVSAEDSYSSGAFLRSR